MAQFSSVENPGLMAEKADVAESLASLAVNLPLRVLVLVAGRGGNVPIRHLLDEQTFRTVAIRPDERSPELPLPPHQVVFNAIGDADLCRAELDRAVDLVERTFAPVVNSPAAVLGTRRVANARRLGSLPGVLANAPEGVLRKYRVLTIDGRLYPRCGSEDGEFLENMPGVLGARAMAALEEIQKTLGLDYAGIEFGLSPAGEVVLFEANATMVVPRPDGEEHGTNRRAAAQRIEEAVRRMLLERAGL